MNEIKEMWNGMSHDEKKEYVLSTIAFVAGAFILAVINAICY